MNRKLPARICVQPYVSGVGGMVSFRKRLATGAERAGVELCYHLADTPYDVVLVIGGTRRLAPLLRARRRGVRIVQRLDGMNWLHRLRLPAKRAKIGMRHFLRAEYSNWLLTFIRNRLAHGIVYQSHFARHWWDRVHGRVSVPCRVIYNGVDLQEFSPHGLGEKPADRYRLLMVEGSLMGGYELGLEAATCLAQDLAARLHSSKHPSLSRDVELTVVGQVGESVRQRWEQVKNIAIRWMGLVEGKRIPEIARSAHLFYSSDINPACPNAVIEALACGLPVIAFDTGALPEIVTGDSGRVISYGGDSWKLDPPNLLGLVEAALEVLSNQDHFRRAARTRAEEAFGLDLMVEEYLDFLLD